MCNRLLFLCLLALPFVTHAQNGFIENKGQITDQNGQPRNDIGFKLKATKGLNLFIGNGQLHYQWTKADAVKAATTALHKKPKINNTPVHFYRMDVTLIGANPNAAVIKENKQNYFERYYLSANNFSGAVAASFEKITYKDIYPHIDWVLYRNAGGELEYDFVVRPGGKVSDIRLQYGGATDMGIAADQSLTASTPYGSVTENAPIAFEKETNKSILTSFSLDGNILSFSAADYNGTLIIDPTLIWGTYFGGNDLDVVYDEVLNADGNLYVTGGTNSTNNIVTNGAYQTTYGGGNGAFNDAYISKFSPDGNCIWSTYYGTDGEDCAKSISADTTGNLYIGGYTNSTTGFGTTGSYQENSGGSYDAFIARFDTSGSRTWGTYYGGSGDDGWLAFSLYCDRFNNVYITGATSSTSGIATADVYQASIADPSSEDAYLAKFNTNGAIQWATYFGGTGGDDASCVTSDTTGDIYLAGYTNSADGIATSDANQNTFAGVYDGFLSKFDTAGGLLWSTYFGGDDFDVLSSVTCDSQLNIYLAGTTISTIGIATVNAFQTTYGGGYQDGMIAKYSSDGTLSWATYLGNSSEDQVDKIIAVKNGGIYLSGFTGGGTNMVTPDAPQSIFGGAYDGFVARFNPDGSQEWSSYLGGADVDEGYALASDNIGNIYVAGNTGSATGIATTNAWQANFGGADLDGFIVKIKDCTPPVTPDGIMGNESICTGSTNTYSVTAADNTEYTWILPDGWQGSSTSSSIDAISDDNGGTIKVVAFNLCDISDTVSLDVTVNPLPVTPLIVENNNILSTTESYDSYQWNTEAGPINGATQPAYAPVTEGNYSVTVTTNAGCSATSDDYAYSPTAVSHFDQIGVSIYPNPANEKVAIKAPFDGTLIISDINGRTQRKTVLLKGIQSISIKGLSTGIYMLHIVSKDGKITGTQKLVKDASYK